MFRVYPLILKTRCSSYERVEFDLFPLRVFRASTRIFFLSTSLPSLVFSSKVPALVGTYLVHRDSKVGTRP